MTSVSIVSLSFSALCGLMEGGGVSIAAAPFFFASFFGAKKDPKKPWSSFFISTSRSLLLLTCDRVFLESGGCEGPFAAFNRSATRAVAYEGNFERYVSDTEGLIQKKSTDLVTTDEIWMRRVHVASLHTNERSNIAYEIDFLDEHVRNHIRNELRCRSHCRLEEIDHYRVEPIFESRISSESLL